MPDELLQTLMRFHREIVMPEFRQEMSTLLDESIGPLRNEMLSHFDAIYQRFDRLETEYTASPHR